MLGWNFVSLALTHLIPQKLPFVIIVFYHFICEFGLTAQPNFMLFVQYDPIKILRDKCTVTVIAYEVCILSIF